MKAVILAAGVALAAISSAAAAQTIHKDGMTAQEVVSWLHKSGYKAELTKDSQGDPKINSAAGGVNFAIHFYDCAASRCKAIQFSAGFDLKDGFTLEKINAWNREHRYLKGYLDKEMDPYVEYDVNVNAGRTISGLDDDFGVWTGMIDDFTKYIDW
ncbi:YbjN domain-containing protein [Caulobacter mirabilis]|uniref:YbjN domain-containing protein n=1 Tax=Caulobacter mirabilis TaxID=69666 RepID=A0A2D2ATR2_9CAUL|nr:YbjN domain-containing protein [Caulobacter mirabilis]ATQ41402.1 YbjN domain-containing protein [Caulobacter mirabilis]